jgi:hypothetical protein
MPALFASPPKAMHMNKKARQIGAESLMPDK